MSQERMGDYEVVSDTRTKETSLRLLRLGAGQSVEPHYHRHATQVYVVIKGAVSIALGAGELPCKPLDTVRIPPRTVHGLHAVEASLVASITVPPLEPDDQHPVPRGSHEPSYGK